MRPERQTYRRHGVEGAGSPPGGGRGRARLSERRIRGGRRRLDELLVDRGLADTRTRAQALILAGRVFSGEARLDKSGRLVADDAPLEVRGQVHPWVSRGGVKLAHALGHFGVDPSDKVCLDIGASTGGFTHVLLERGARRVYAVDVGRGQLAWLLRRDERVVVLEKTNCRLLSRDDVPEPVDVIVCDVSFIGLQTALPAPLRLAAPPASLIALIKPQFEAGREHVGKGGIVRDVGVRRGVCDRIVSWLAALDDWSVVGVVESPITGADGNVEYLIAATRT